MPDIKLEQQLWKIADTLRGKMDADDFRDYIHCQLWKSIADIIKEEKAKTGSRNLNTIIVLMDLH